MMTGPLLTELGNLKHLINILMGALDFQGILPSEMGNNTKINRYNISNNKLTVVISF